MAVLSLVYFFWAMWLLDTFLPPKPDETPLEEFLGKQLMQPQDKQAAKDRLSPEMGDPSGPRSPRRQRD